MHPKKLAAKLPVRIRLISPIYQALFYRKLIGLTIRIRIILYIEPHFQSIICFLFVSIRQTRGISNHRIYNSLARFIIFAQFLQCSIFLPFFIGLLNFLKAWIIHVYNIENPLVIIVFDLVPITGTDFNAFIPS